MEKIAENKGKNNDVKRKINKELLKKLQVGELKPLLEYLKKNKEKLRLEVRTNGKFAVYYKKCKVLEVGVKSFKLDKKYFIDKEYPSNIFKMLKNDPKGYFDYVCNAVDEWFNKKKNKKEFETQQNIASDNQEKTDKYIILDMEYNFPQNKIDKDERIKRAGFDLMGIDRNTNKIVFFEVKRGLGSLRGKSGIGGHIEDFEAIFNNGTEGQKEIFRENIVSNVINIVNDKNALGLLDFQLPENLNTNEFEFIFIFEPDSDNMEIEHYNKIFESESKGKNYKTLFVSPKSYKLS